MNDKFSPLSAQERAKVKQRRPEKDEGIAIVPVPHDAPQEIPVHPSLGKPETFWGYRDAHGWLLFKVCRFISTEGKKEDRPLTYREYQDGSRHWAWKALDEPRPLYGLDRLAMHPDAPVIVCEGEKATDAATRLFPSHVAVTSPNGAGSAHKAIWSPLAGRDVTIWPDHDDEGRKYAQSVAELAKAGGANSICNVNVPDDFPQKWDLADDLPNDRTLDDLERLLNTANKHQEESGSNILLLRMEDVEMKPIQWLWENRIALGKLTVIAGQPGLGKSQIAAMLAAHVTAPKDFPDGARTEVGDVIILSGEDDVADTIKPRLVASGADIKRCHCLEGIKTTTKGKTTFRMFDLEQDIEPLEKTVREIGNVKALIIDPVSAYQGKTDSHNNAEIRALLTPYAKLAAQYNISIILVTHFNKSTSQEPIERVIGSIGLIAAARAGYAVMKDEENGDLRYFLPLKNNIGNDKDGFSFNVESVLLENGIKTSRINWNNIPVLAQKVFYPKKKTTQTNAATAFLADLLSNGPMLTTDVLHNGEGAGYDKSSLQRARQRLGGKIRKLGFDKGWIWFLPEHEGRVTEMMKSSEPS